MSYQSGPRMASGVSSPGLLISLHFSPHQWLMYTNRMSEVKFHNSAVFPWGGIRSRKPQFMCYSNRNQPGPRMASYFSTQQLMVSFLLSYHRGLVLTKDYHVVKFHSNAAFHCRVITSHTVQYVFLAFNVKQTGAQNGVERLYERTNGLLPSF